MEIKSVALIGAGGIGAWFIPGLSVALGERFSIIAEGERAQRLKDEGLIINGRHYELNVKSAVEAAAAGVDLLIVATKYNALEEVMPQIKEIIDVGYATGRETADERGTMVISALNGVDSEDLIGSVIGQEHMLYSFMRVIIHREGNEVTISNNARTGLVFGEKDTTEKTERCQAVENLLAGAGIGCRFTPNIIQEQWQKFELNLANNLPQAVFGVGYGAYLDSEHVSYIHDCIAFECMMVAKKLGINIEYEENYPGKALANARFSTLQDLDAGRETEIDMLAGVLLQKAREVDMPVPFTEYTYHAIKALEEKNAGLFDYKPGVM